MGDGELGEAVQSITLIPAKSVERRFIAILAYLQSTGCSEEKMAGNPRSKPPIVFLHAQFEVPESSSSDNTTSKVVKQKQHFTSADCKPARIGLEGEPVKAR